MVWSRSVCVIKNFLDYSLGLVEDGVVSIRMCDQKFSRLLAEASRRWYGLDPYV